MIKWINPSDKLPIGHNLVVVIGKDGKQGEGWFCHGWHSAVKDIVFWRYKNSATNIEYEKFEKEHIKSMRNILNKYNV